MKRLLDTHAILWMITDDPRLSETARRMIAATDDIVWTTASLWEIGIKQSLNRPDFQMVPSWERLIPEEMTRNNIGRLDLQPAHCARVAKLPWHHRDPFDRLLIAQALCEKRNMVSRYGGGPLFLAAVRRGRARLAGARDQRPQNGQPSPLAAMAAGRDQFATRRAHVAVACPLHGPGTGRLAEADDFMLEPGARLP